MGKITVLISHALSLKLSSNNNPWALYKSNSQPQLKFKSKLYPNPPFKAKLKHTSKLLESFVQLPQTIFHESQALSYLCLQAILSPNINPDPISNPTIPPTPRFLLQPIFYLLCICNCSTIPLWLPIMRIYLHIAVISASTIICAAK